MLTLDGRCKTLDASADGYVRAEAAIVIRLDPIVESYSGSSASAALDYSNSGTSGGGQAAACVMSGSFVNQDGRSSSLTAPNGPSQQLVILGALAAAGGAPADVAALEMHGTGTPLGTPRGQICRWCCVPRVPFDLCTCPSAVNTRNLSGIPAMILCKHPSPRWIVSQGFLSQG